MAVAKGDPSLVVLAVNNGEAPDKVAKVAQERGYQFPVLTDGRGEVHRLYGVTLRPTTVYVAPDGTVKAYRVGAHTAEAWREQLALIRQR